MIFVCSINLYNIFSEVFRSEIYVYKIEVLYVHVFMNFTKNNVGTYVIETIKSVLY